MPVNPYNDLADLLSTQNVCYNQWVRKYLEFYTQKSGLSKHMYTEFHSQRNFQFKLE